MGSHVAIGVFDGVHAGHRAVLASAVAAARPAREEVVALTFEPHPSRLLRPDRPVPLILNRQQKDARLAEAGAHRVVHQPFDAAHREIRAGDYVAWLLARFPGLRSLHVGDNFRYGKGREGDALRLAEEARAAGLAVGIVPPVRVDAEVTSSSRIREALLAGEIAKANAMLVRPYEAEGTVEAGRQIGRTLGFPTLNLRWQPELIPAHGVYAAEVVTPAGVAEPAVANWGLRPTVESSPAEPLLEAHLLRPSGPAPVPGDAIRVRWLSWIRPERRFGDVTELRAQIGEDSAEAARRLGLA